MGIEFVCVFGKSHEYVCESLLKILTVDSFESIVWWLAKWRVVLCSCLGILVIANMILSKGWNLSLAWRLPSGKCQLKDLLFNLHLWYFFCCVLRCWAAWVRKDFCAWKLKAFNKTVFLTFRVASTIFNVLVIYLKAPLIFILGFNIWHIHIT